MENAVKQINRIIDSGTPDELMTWLQKPEGLLPVVDASRPNLYKDNLKKAKADKGSVSYLNTNKVTPIFGICQLAWYCQLG